MLSLYLRQISPALPRHDLDDSPFKINRLDDKPERWAYGSDIFVHDPLDDGRFARVIQAPVDTAVSQALPGQRRVRTASIFASLYLLAGLFEVLTASCRA